MKWFAFTLGGVLLGTAAYIILSERDSGRGDQAPVTELAEQLQHAWADHHTVV